MPGFDTLPCRFYANDGVEISGKTKLYGILGWPVSHSLSPVFQARFFRQYDLDAVYVPFAAPPERLQQALEGLWAIGVEGANVTVPHKEVVNAMVSADADARLIGAVNTIRRTESGWQGTNTDWLGLQTVVQQAGLDLRGNTALLFGAGGTARAIVHALASLGLSRLYVCNRGADRLQALLEHVRQNYPNLEAVVVRWAQADVTAACKQSALLVNSTSVGLDGETGFPFELDGAGVALDAVYRPDGQTPFCLAARAAGRQAGDGLPMLVAQGAASFGWWFDGKLPDWSETLDWMEERLGRTHALLPQWRMAG
ncbi:MAG TPA: shikimate dehydrogenase [Mariprofundaceae bacterium]|nr:shikimate dehydrogenase [Mariprofundaceae bacterium]